MLGFDENLSELTDDQLDDLKEEVYNLSCDITHELMDREEKENSED